MREFQVTPQPRTKRVQRAIGHANELMQGRDEERELEAIEQADLDEQEAAWRSNPRNDGSSPSPREQLAIQHAGEVLGDRYEADELEQAEILASLPGGRETADEHWARAKAAEARAVETVTAALAKGRV